MKRNKIKVAESQITVYDADEECPDAELSVIIDILDHFSIYWNMFRAKNCGKYRKLKNLAKFINQDQSRGDLSMDLDEIFILYYEGYNGRDELVAECLMINLSPADGIKLINRVVKLGSFL